VNCSTWVGYGAVHKKIPQLMELRDFGFRSLAMTYSHMGKPHTTIGDASFHF
jgi:hypothetical protein